MNRAFARALLRIALLTCPREFRDEYGSEIEADLDDHAPSFAAIAGLLTDVLRSGVALRGETLARDAGFALRMLAKSPVFVIVAVAAIALAIGVNVAVGSVVEHLMIHPLPYAQQDRLVYVYSTVNGLHSDSIDYPDARDLAARNRTFSALSAGTDDSGTMIASGTPLTIHGWLVGPGYFDVLGVRPELGRLLDRSDPGKRTLVISDELWRRRFAADSRVVGTAISIDDVAYTIVGVAPPHTPNPSPSGFLAVADYWKTVDPRSDEGSSRGWRSFDAIGRLAPGVTVAAARADLQRIARDLQKEHAKEDRDRGVDVVPLADAMMGSVYPLLFIIQAAVLIVFLIAGANVAALLVARAAAREAEMRTRVAVGATQRRIAAQLTVETGLLAIAGSAAGIVLGALALDWLHDAVSGMMPAGSLLPGWDHLRLDAPILGYVVLLAVVFTLVVGLLPALTSRRDLSASQSGVRRSESRGAGRLRRALVATEMTLAFVLVITAGLVLRSFFVLDRLDIGFDGANLHWVELGSLPGDRYPSNAVQRAFVDRLLPHLRAIPGVSSVGESSVQLFGENEDTDYQTPGEAHVPPDRWVNVNVVAPGYFDTLNVPLLRGRDFVARDSEKAQPVAIVSRRFALHAFGTPDAVGREVAIGMSSGGGNPMRRIVGVVGDVRHRLSSPPAQEIYAPLGQIALIRGFAVRAAGPAPHLAQEIAAVERGIDPRMPPPVVTTFQRMRDFDSIPNRYTAIVLATLASIALLLALSGIYGVVTTSVAQRTREFGIRMALGAHPGRVVLEAIRETLALTAVSIGLGLALSVLCTRVLANFLVETSPLDGATFAVVTLLVLGTSLAACAGPARRAIATDPAAALRYE